LPLGREAGKEGGAGEVKGCWGAERGDGLGLYFFDQAKCCWGEAAVAVDDERGEAAAQGDTVSTVLALLVALPLGHGFARGQIDVVSGVGVDAGEIEEDGASGHEDFAVWKEVGEILLDDVSQAVVASGVLAQQIASVVVAARNDGAFELGAAQTMPWVHPEVDTFLAKETVCGHAVDGWTA
jgi:hypothetical protein